MLCVRHHLCVIRKERQITCLCMCLRMCYNCPHKDWNRGNFHSLPLFFSAPSSKALQKTNCRQWQTVYIFPWSNFARNDICSHFLKYTYAVYLNRWWRWCAIYYSLTIVFTELLLPSLSDTPVPTYARWGRTSWTISTLSHAHYIKGAINRQCIKYSVYRSNVV